MITRLAVSEYNKVRESVEEARTNMLRQLDNPGWRILDAGSGRHSQERLGRATVITMDIENSPGLTVVGDIHDIPFPDNDFNGIVCTQVLEHVADPLKACREMYRILKPRGFILITVPFVWKEHFSPVDYWRFTRDGCRHLLTQAGFVDIEIRSNGGYFISLSYLLNKLGSKLLGKYLGNAYKLLYKPVGYLLYFLDKLFPHPEFSINHSVYGRKSGK